MTTVKPVYDFVRSELSIIFKGWGGVLNILNSLFGVRTSAFENGYSTALLSICD